MSLQNELMLFYPEVKTLSKYVDNELIPDETVYGMNPNEDYAILFASMLKYGEYSDFKIKLTSAVEPYYSNGQDVKYFMAQIYRTSMNLSVTEWEECVYGYAGMGNAFQSAALLKANIFGGMWIGSGYMDFDYIRRRATMVVASMKNMNMVYEGTDTVNVDIMKNVGSALQMIHNASALYRHGLPLESFANQNHLKMYSSASSGEVDFRNLTPEDLDSIVKIVCKWGEGKALKYPELSKIISQALDKVSPDVLWDLITCGVHENYEQYEGLSRDYVKALLA